MENERIQELLRRLKNNATLVDTECDEIVEYIDNLESKAKRLRSVTSYLDSLYEFEMGEGPHLDEIGLEIIHTLGYEF